MVDVYATRSASLRLMKHGEGTSLLEVSLDLFARMLAVGVIRQDSQLTIALFGRWASLNTRLFPRRHSGQTRLGDFETLAYAHIL